MSNKGNGDLKIIRFSRPIDRKKRVLFMCKPISRVRGKTAQDLLAMCNQIDAVPVDLKSLLNKLNISCVAFDFSKIENVRREKGICVEDDPILGALATNGDKAVIFYRKQDQEEGHRYRFTIAHELAHICLDHYEIGKSSVHLAYRHENRSNDIREYDANVFAGQLLIPRDTLEKVMSELIMPSVDSLAAIFAVSKNVMLARLRHLEISKKVVGYNCN